MRIRNRTRYEHRPLIVYGRGGAEMLVLLVKASLQLAASKPELHDVPLRIFESDQRLPSGAYRYPSDFALTRAGTDVVCVGTAWAPGGQAVEFFDASLQVADVGRTVRVFGRRTWQQRAGAWSTSRDLIASLPLGWEHAFGGSGVAENPVGMGADAREGTELPHIEDPSALVRSPSDRPTPAGFGAVAPHWEPRVGRAGTYDDAWKRERAPFLPDDFDERFFHVAATGLTTARPLRGGEPIRLRNLTRHGALDAEVPRIALRVIVEGKRLVPSLDLLLIEPDEGRISLTFRTTLDITGRLDSPPDIDVVELRITALGEGVRAS